jgi:hypothetical protein
MDELEQLKMENVSGVPDPQGLVGGEDIANAVNIPALPYSDGGSTCGFLNNYDAVCPFTGSTSPDVVYRYAGSGLSLEIDLCNSGYDTKVYVYENNSSTLVACNDDACGSDGFRSYLPCVPTTVGNTYYIVVDGYGGACGTYDLQVNECMPCVVDCPSGSIAEGEVDCFDDYKDTYNAGCNSTPPTFSALPCDSSMTVCGTYGGYFHSPSGFNYRDTDWYSIPAANNTAGLTYCVTGSLETLSGYINASLGCGAPVFVEFAVSGACDTQCYNIPPGDYWLFVATSGFGGADFPCGSDYVISVDGLKNCGPIAVEKKSWGEIKGSYRE